MRLKNFEVYKVKKEFLNENTGEELDFDIDVVPIGRDFRDGSLKFIRLDTFTEQYFDESSEDFEDNFYCSSTKVDLLNMYRSYLERQLITFCETEPNMMKREIETLYTIIKILRKT
jgi:hypothetical protein